jgi:hypothetical protein
MSPWQDASHWRLALAIVLSLSLHFFLIEKFNYKLSSNNENTSFIEARLALPKAITHKVQKTIVEKKTFTKQVKLKIHDHLKEVKVSEKLFPIDLDPPLPTNSQTANAAELIDSPEFVEPSVENQEDGVGLIAKSMPYQYVETEFDVYTSKIDQPNHSRAGIAKIVYQQLPNSEKYQIKSLIQAKGLVSFVIPDLLQTSDGYLDGIGLKPTHYLYQFGNNKSKTFHADFDWERKILTLRSEKSEEKLELGEHTQDLLSFMYQFMFVPPLQNMQLSITNGKKLGVYEYAFEGEETISTKMGDLKTFHLIRMAEEGEKRTELWLALDYQHVPVKIRETDKEGKFYELQVTNLKTQQLSISQE